MLDELTEPMTGSAAHPDSPIRLRPPREAAQVQIAQAALLLNQAARSITRWAADADRIVLAPDQDSRYSFGFGNPSEAPATLDERCQVAKRVGDMAAACEGWAAMLVEVEA